MPIRLITCRCGKQGLLLVNNQYRIVFSRDEAVKTLLRAQEHDLIKLGEIQSFSPLLRGSLLPQKAKRPNIEHHRLHQDVFDQLDAKEKEILPVWFHFALPTCSEASKT